MKTLYTYFFLILLSISIACTSDRKEEVIIIGTSADNPPYEFIENEKILGIDIEVGKYIAKELNKEIIWKNMDFNTLIPHLEKGDLDIVIAGLNKTSERAKKVDFSNSYYTTEIAFVCNQDSAVDRVQDAMGKNIGAQSGSTWEQFAIELSSKYSLNLRSLSNNLTMVVELNRDNLDCLIMEELQAEIFSLRNPKLKSFIIPHSKSEFSIAVNKNSSLTKKINDILYKMQQENFINKIKSQFIK